MSTRLVIITVILMKHVLVIRKFIKLEFKWLFIKKIKNTSMGLNIW